MKLCAEVIVVIIATLQLIAMARRFLCLLMEGLSLWLN